MHHGRNNRANQKAEEDVIRSGFDIELFASNVFTNREMLKRVPKSVYESYRRSVDAFDSQESTVVDVVAMAIKDWAISKGATHYTHWFQPIHTYTAEKHESFVTPTGDFNAIFSFTGEQLLRGEPDASSFPNGGLRSTSQARGYTTWDPTSPPFVRYSGSACVLYIPTCFCSWTGVALDTKTPLLRSCRVLSSQATHLLKLLGDTNVQRVESNIGAEQEFFIVSAEHYAKRPDLTFSGRTIFGTSPIKGQELEDHYFSPMSTRVLTFIQEVELELWKLGICAHTRHSEVAPGQHEMVALYEVANLASDHNTIHMELLQTVAPKHGLMALLHEKPFSGINGCGKHNNWSLSTDCGLNLFEPSDNPRDNLVFQVFLCCVIRSVDVHADLLRSAIAVPGNDWRLGISEAPPSIMSVYLGSEISELVDYLLSTTTQKYPAQGDDASEKRISDALSILHIAPSAVAPFKRDRTDRNRTSPFAFTGNKFEFRAPGSSQSLAHTATILNTIIADSIRKFNEELEIQLRDNSLESSALIVTQMFLRNHRRVLFELDGYSESWSKLAKDLGLPHFAETVIAIEQFASQKNIELFDSLNVLAPTETKARYNIDLSRYINTIKVEANCAVSMVSVHIIPAIFKYQKRIAETILLTYKVICEEPASTQQSLDHLLLTKIRSMNLILLRTLGELKRVVTCSNNRSHSSPDLLATARWHRDTIKPAIANVRNAVDALEEVVDANLWPFPKYSHMLFGI